MRFPFHHLNLSHNPFGEPLPEDRGRLAVLAPGELDRWGERLRTGGRVIQFLGDEGRGKSTRLHALGDRFPDAPYLYFAEDEPRRSMVRRLAETAGAPVLLLDETQRLSRWARWKLWRRPGVAIALASHRDHGLEIERAGLRVETVQVGAAEEGRDPVEVLSQVVRRRIEWARRGGGPVPEVSRETLAELVAAHGDDQRAIEDRLYDRFQALERRTPTEEGNRWRGVI